MKLRHNKIESATNSCNIPAKPRTLEGFAADISNVVGGDYSVDDDRRFNPPEYDDPDVNEWTEIIEIDFEDVPITILPDTSWDYRDEQDDFARNPDSKNGKWYSEEDRSVFLGTATDMVEHIDDLIISQLPSTAGDYLISGHAELYFTVTEEDYGEDYEKSVDVDFDYDSSRVTNFECKPD